MKMYYRVSFFLSFIILHIFSGAASALNPVSEESPPGQMMSQTLEALYDFNFSKADSISGRMQQINQGHYISHFTRATYLWWMIITHPFDQDLENEYSQVIKEAGKLVKIAARENDLNDVFYLINIYAMQARLHLDKKEYLPTIGILNSCLRQVEFSIGKEDLHPGFYLTSGLYNYMTGFASEKIPLLGMLSMFYPKGEMQQGLQQLHIAANSENLLWKTEANFLLMKIFLEMEMKPLMALTHANWLIGRYPQNLIYHHYLYMIFKAMKNPVAMEAVKKEIIKMALNHQGINKEQQEFFLDYPGLKSELEIAE